MSGRALVVRVAPADRDRIGAWLVAQTGQTVAEQSDGALYACVESEAQAAALADALRAGPAQADIEILPIPTTDWSTAWREGLAPRRFGRLLVAPSWHTSASDAAASTSARVLLDPEMAFGSGEHGSTRTALMLLERFMVPGAKVLDLGSGSGILAIAAAALGASSAIGIESDADAIPVAERNAERNGVRDRVRFLEGDAAMLAALAGPADLILSNILRTVNVTMLPAIVAALAPEGVAIFAGMEMAEAELFRAELERAGFAQLAQTLDAGWWGVAVRRA